MSEEESIQRVHNAMILARRVYEDTRRLRVAKSIATSKTILARLEQSSEESRRQFELFLAALSAQERGWFWVKWSAIPATMP